MSMFHQEHIQHHEEIAMNLVAKLNEDQGSTLRIEELERQSNLLRSAMEHVHRVHQNSTEDYAHGIARIEEASHAQHLRDEELATSLHQEVGQIRSEAARVLSSYKQQVQGEGQQLALEYQKLVDELNHKARENLHFRMEASQHLSAVAVMKEQMGLMKNEENILREEASKRVSAMESGARDLQNRLDREEFGRSEATLRLERAEAIAAQSRDVPLTALHGELGELRQRLRQQEELQARSQRGGMNLKLLGDKIT